MDIQQKADLITARLNQIELELTRAEARPEGPGLAYVEACGKLKAELNIAVISIRNMDPSYGLSDALREDDGAQEESDIQCGKALAELINFPTRR